VTIERKIVVSLEEIKAVIFECATKDCKARTVLSPQNISSIPEQCPHNHHWDWKSRKEIEQHSSKTPYPAFIASLKRLTSPDSYCPGFHIFLEFDEPKML